MTKCGKKQKYKGLKMDFAYEEQSDLDDFRKAMEPACGIQQ